MPYVAVDPVDDVCRRRSGSEYLGDACLLELGDVRAGDDPAAEHEDVVSPLLLEKLDDLWEQGHVSTREARKSHRIDILLDRGRRDLLRGLVKAGVDDLHPGVAQGASDHLDATIVTIETGLGDQDPWPAGRHFWNHSSYAQVVVAISVRNPSRDQRRLLLPQARDLPFAHLIDEGSFTRAEDELASTDPIGFPNYAAALEAARSGSGTDESVAAGAATIAGHKVEIASFDFSFLGGSMGEVAGERVARAVERAAERSVPFIMRSATGGARMQEGMRSLIQMPKLVAARATLGDAHVPFLAVLGDPSTGGVLASIGGLADVTLVEAGATVGFAGPRVVESVTGARPSSSSHTAPSALGNGMVDAIVEQAEAGAVLGRILTVLEPDAPQDIEVPGEASDSGIDPWDAVGAARSSDRPTGGALVRSMDVPIFELRGDRAGKDDPASFMALTRISGRRALVIALDRRVAPGPSTYRKARRCLTIAARLRLPVVTLIDTRGADPSEVSEAGGIAWEIAALFEAMLAFPLPVVSIVTGEGGSGGALAFATGDVLLAYEHSIFSVIGPEAAAAILWRSSDRAPDAAHSLKLTSNELKRLGIADGVLPEPLTGRSVAHAVAYHLDRIFKGSDDLVATRRQRWRDRVN